MSALTAPYDARRKEGDRVRYPIAANTEVFKGGLAVLSVGYVQPGADAAAVQFVGVFSESVNNATNAVQPGQIAPSLGSPNLTPVAGAAGAFTVKVEKEGAFVYNKAGAVQTDLGKARVHRGRQHGVHGGHDQQRRLRLRHGDRGRLPRPGAD